MPKLLKTGEVQLHMPRTGGKSLAKDLGIKKLVGTMHDGPDQIPESRRDYPTVATFRDPLSWWNSMEKYLRSLDGNEDYHNFSIYSPYDVSRLNIDPTFGLWDDPECCFFGFALHRNYSVWYELYIDYFVAPADRIVSISNLKNHIT